MPGRDPLFPNAGIVARREYRDRTRSRLYLGSTVVLAFLAAMVAIAPIAMRAMDRQTVTRIAIVAADAELGLRAVSVADGLLNPVPPGATAATFKKPFLVELVEDGAASAGLANGKLGGVMLVRRLDDGQVDVVLRTTEGPNSPRSLILSVAAFGIGVLDWSARLPPDATRDAFHPPTFNVEAINTATTDAGVALDARAAASRYVLGLVFVILLLISIIIYGMWVATGVAAEKSSRVMELMISAASAPQMLTGKVVGIGAAGLTQYIAIAIPAFVLLALQNQIATAVLGPDWVTGAPLGGMSVPLLLGYGVFFLLGFVLFALIYASMGSFVSRPDDLQTLSLPLSLVAMAGYLVAVVALGGASGGFIVLASFVPPFSPFVMLARLMVSAVQPWEIVLSVGLLVAAIAVTAVFAVRMYAAGVLLYGQRPGLGAFLAAARRG